MSKTKNEKKPFSAKHIGRKNCITCDSDKIRPVFLISREGIYPGEEGHEIVYSHAVIVECGSCGCGQIEELEHDCFDWEDDFDQYDWYHITKEDMRLLSERIKKCKEPLNEECKCEIHKQIQDAMSQLPRLTWKAVVGYRERVHDLVVLKDEKLIFEIVKKDAKKN
ncbi:MAG: hypothetical protein QXT63_00980 [Thermoplasmata archaeon]